MKVVCKKCVILLLLMQLYSQTFLETPEINVQLLAFAENQNEHIKNNIDSIISQTEYLSKINSFHLYVTVLIKQNNPNKIQIEKFINLINDKEEKSKIYLHINKHIIENNQEQIISFRNGKILNKNIILNSQWIDLKIITKLLLKYSFIKTKSFIQDAMEQINVDNHLISSYKEKEEEISSTNDNMNVIAMEVNELENKVNDITNEYKIQRKFISSHNLSSIPQKRNQTPKMKLIGACLISFTLFFGGLLLISFSVNISTKHRNIELMQIEQKRTESISRSNLFN